MTAEEFLEVYKEGSVMYCSKLFIDELPEGIEAVPCLQPHDHLLATAGVTEQGNQTGVPMQANGEPIPGPFHLIRRKKAQSGS